MTGKRSAVTVLLQSALLACVLALLAGCSSSEEKAPSGYYDGPKASKGMDDDSKTPGQSQTQSPGGTQAPGSGK